MRTPSRSRCATGARYRNRAPALSVVRWGGADIGECRVVVALNGEIADRHHPDGTAAVDDREAADCLVTHHLDGLFDAVLRGHRRNVAAADLADGHAVRVLAVGDHPNGDVAVGD